MCELNISLANATMIAKCLKTNLLGQAKTHEKVDSLGENRSIAVHAVIMLIREDLY